jgi:exonuclease VII large subunit
LTFNCFWIIIDTEADVADMTSNNVNVTRAEMEQFVVKFLETHLSKAMEDYVERNELRAKELALMERMIRVEEELKSLREMSEKRFEALQRELHSRFEAVNDRFEAVNDRFEAMDKRFEAMDKRFELIDKRFEAVNDRFEAMDKRFTMVQWMIGLLVGIPAVTITIIQLLKAI